MHQLCQEDNNLKEVKVLLENNHPVDCKDFSGFTPLHEAALHGDLTYVTVNLLTSFILALNNQQALAIGNDIAILLESFNKNSIDGAVTALLAELACGGL